MATVESLVSNRVSVLAHLHSNDGMKETDHSKKMGISTMTSEQVLFDPTRHLNYTPPTKVYSLKELGYPETRGVSLIGVSEPFPLFSPEAIQTMRDEVLRDEVFAKYRFHSELAQCQLRGYAQEYAPFTYDVWKHPETLAIMSKIAGVDLVTAIDLEIGHINISIHSGKGQSTVLESHMERMSHETDEGVAGCPWDNDKPIVDWHTDSYPFVCVTMLSDCKDMVGGETALRRGDGEVVKVRGPQMGSAIILQGRYIEHRALRALGTAERITMVTSFRPRSSAMKDDTVLTTVRPISHLGDLYHQFAEYRFEMLQDRFRDANKAMCAQMRARRRFDTRGLKQFIRKQIDFLEHMDKEIVDDDQVQEGIFDDSHLVSEDLRLRQSKKRAYAALG